MDEPISKRAGEKRVRIIRGESNCLQLVFHPISIYLDFIEMHTAALCRALCLVGLIIVMIKQVKSRIKYQSHHNNFNDFMCVSNTGQTNLAFLRSLRQRLLLSSFFPFVSLADPLLIQSAQHSLPRSLFCCRSFFT